MKKAFWILKTGWKESRGQKLRLGVYFLAVCFGVASIYIVEAFRNDIEAYLEDQSKILLGADAVLTSRFPFSKEVEAILETYSGHQSREIRFTSMVIFPDGKGSQLIQARALEPGFPYYGEWDVSPAEAQNQWANAQGTIVDQSVMAQHNLSQGDVIIVGEQEFPVMGGFSVIPGETSFRAFVAPMIFIPYAAFKQDYLLGKGSRVRYRTYLKGNPLELEAILDQIQPFLARDALRIRTPEERREDLGEGANNISRFLNLIGFCVLLLGGVGIGGAVLTYVERKKENAAVLQSLGLEPWGVFFFFGFQILIWGFIGAFFGLLMGAFIHFSAPELLQTLIGFDIQPRFWPLPALEALLLGFFTACAFGWAPLTRVLDFSPSILFQPSAPTSKRKKIISGLIFTGAVLLISIWKFQPATQGLLIGAGALAVVAFFLLASTVLVYVSKKMARLSWSFPLRHGLANLHRPNNLTPIILTTLGLGIFLALLIYHAENSLSEQISYKDGVDQPNFALFDVQPRDLRSVKEKLTNENIPILQTVPIVSLKLKEIKGKNVQTIKEDPDRKIDMWALNREYRCTYRDHLIDTEQLLSGTFVSEWDGRGDIPVTLEQGIADELGVKIGDQLTFELDGVELKIVVSGIRQVNWFRLKPNFFALFPVNVLEEAPHFNVITTRVRSPEEAGRIQTLLAASFPTVSAINLARVKDSIEGFLNKATLALKFIALMSAGAGLIVLIGALWSGKAQRYMENSLIVALGGGKKFLFLITMAEFFFLGALAFSLGLALSLVGAWAISRFYLETIAIFNWEAAFWVGVGAFGLVFLVGWTNASGALKASPAQALKSAEES